MPESTDMVNTMLAMRETARWRLAGEVVSLGLLSRADALVEIVGYPIERATELVRRADQERAASATA